MNTPEGFQGGQPELKRHRLSPKKIAEIKLPPYAFSIEQIEAIEAMGRKHIDPFEVLRDQHSDKLSGKLRPFRDPLPEDIVARIVTDLSANPDSGFVQTKKGPRIPANRIRIFFNAVRESLPVPSYEDFDKYWVRRGEIKTT
jgi:hypothetical protein